MLPPMLPLWKAAQGMGTQTLKVYNASSHRIQVDIADNFEQMAVIFNKQRFIAPLENVAGRTYQPIESISKRT